MSPTVKRYPTGQWVVTCGACTDGLFGMFDSWAKASTWRGAMALAHWHAELHTEQRCPTCLHEPPLSKPTVLTGDRSLFKFDGNLYRLIDDRVVEMTEAPR